PVLRPHPLYSRAVGIDVAQGLPAGRSSQSRHEKSSRPGEPLDRRRPDRTPRERWSRTRKRLPRRRRGVPVHAPSRRESPGRGSWLYLAIPSDPVKGLVNSTIGGDASELGSDAQGGALCHLHGEQVIAHDARDEGGGAQEGAERESVAGRV